MTHSDPEGLDKEQLLELKEKLPKCCPKCAMASMIEAFYFDESRDNCQIPAHEVLDVAATLIAEMVHDAPVDPRVVIDHMTEAFSEAYKFYTEQATNYHGQSVH